MNVVSVRLSLVAINILKKNRIFFNVLDVFCSPQRSHSSASSSDLRGAEQSEGL